MPHGCAVGACADYGHSMGHGLTPLLFAALSCYPDRGTEGVAGLGVHGGVGVRAHLGGDACLPARCTSGDVGGEPYCDRSDGATFESARDLPSALVSMLGARDSADELYRSSEMLSHTGSSLVLAPVSAPNIGRG